MSSCQDPPDAFYETVLKDVQQVGQVSLDSIGGQVKDFYTLALKDRDALNKDMVCKMKCKGSCSGGRDREKECVTPVNSMPQFLQRTHGFTFQKLHK
jgi:hypothetical protein